jgi:hypothetical protein
LDDYDLKGNKVDYSFYGSDSNGINRSIATMLLPCLTFKMQTQNELLKENIECYASENETPEELKQRIDDTIKYIGAPQLLSL